jgi:hypothetical protein
MGLEKKKWPKTKVMIFFKPAQNESDDAGVVCQPNVGG